MYFPFTDSHLNIDTQTILKERKIKISYKIQVKQRNYETYALLLVTGSIIHEK